MVRTVITDGTMELEVGYRPVVVSPKSERVLNNEAKVLLLLSPVDITDIALINEMELDAYDVDRLIEQLELFRDIIAEENEKIK
jgi:hypothetical protein